MLRVEILDSSPPPHVWAEIARHCPAEHAFLVAGWFPAWASSFLGIKSWEEPMRYLLVKNEVEAIGALPLAVQRINRVRFLSLPGYYFPFRAIPISERDRTAVMERLADALTDELGHVGFRVGPVDERDAGARGLLDALRRRAWRVHELGSRSQFIVDLPESFEAYRGMLGKTLKTHTAYYERKMTREHEVVISKFTGLAPGEWVPVIEEIASIEHRSWLEEKSRETLQFGLPEAKRFWIEFLRSEAASRLVKVWMIHMDGKPVSFCFTIDSGTTRNVIANSYDRDVRDYSTGSILYMKVLEDAFTAGITTVNMGIGDSGYKQRWCARNSAQTRDYLALRPGLRGTSFYAMLQVKRRLDELRK